MKQNSAHSSAPRSLCSAITAKGRRCRYSVSQPGSAHCSFHSRPGTLRQTPIEANPLADLPPELAAFRSYDDVNRFLARVLTLLSEDRISPRRAAVLSYIANSILNSLRAEERRQRYEDALEPEEKFVIDWSTIPRPQRDLQEEPPPEQQPAEQRDQQPPAHEPVSSHSSPSNIRPAQHNASLSPAHASSLANTQPNQFPISTANPGSPVSIASFPSSTSPNAHRGLRLNCGPHPNALESA